MQSTTDTPCEMTVATPAPATPMPSTAMFMGEGLSRMRLMYSISTCTS